MSKATSQISKREREAITNVLSEIDEQLDVKKPVATFVTSMLTEGEQLTIGRRLLIAQRLLAGCTQHEIRNELRVSPNTITNTRQWLLGKVPEYSEVLRESERIARARAERRDEKQYKPREHIDPYSFAGMKKRYPMHFLLFTLAEELMKKGAEK
jgi:Trp operon repressor